MKDQPADSQTTDDLAPVYKRLAVKWLMWDRGMTAEAAAVCVEAWPDAAGRFPEAVDGEAHTFIVDECHGR